MIDPESEMAIVLALIAGAAGMGDPAFSKDIHAVSGSALERVLSQRVAIAHIDAGSRTLEEPGRQVSAIKVAVYEIGFGDWRREARLNHHIIRWDNGRRATNLLYAVGDYRVRQSLSYLIEVAALYSALERLSGKGFDIVIGIKDGPLVQQLAQYLSPAFDTDEKTVLAALRYAGLSPGKAGEVTAMASVGAGRASTGAAAAIILGELLEKAEAGEAYPAGVVENTSRSSTLIHYLLGDLIVKALDTGHTNPRKLAQVIQGIVDEWLSNALQTENVGEIIGTCICEEPRAVDHALTGVARGFMDMLEEIDASLRSRGVKGGLAEVREKAAGGAREEALIDVVRALVSSQLVTELSARDPDIVMASYYLGVLRSHATAPFTRLELISSTYDGIAALERRSRERGRRVPDVADALLRVARGLRARYLVVDPPPTCSSIEERLSRRRVRRILSPCTVASLDTYTYAPPVRLEYFTDTPGGLSIASIAFLESSVTRYKHPIGILLADKASRVSKEEILAGKSLLQRLVPLRYFIRSWEKRAEFT